MSPTDRDVLVALYKATDGPRWTHSYNWDTDADLSEWRGVTLNGEGRVVTLWLCDNRLRGRIPPELGKLGALQELNLTGNRLSGPIPKELGALFKLETLELGDNALTGAIPAQFGALNKLVRLDLSFNQLSGVPNSARVPRFSREDRDSEVPGGPARQSGGSPGTVPGGPPENCRSSRDRFSWTGRNPTP